MSPQITILRSAPRPDSISRVRNAPGYRGEGIDAWLRKQYCGNKPSGGLWTSSHTPEDEYESDWARGMATNALIQRAFPRSPEAKPYRLTPSPAARVMEITDLSSTVEFTKRFRLSRVAIPDQLLAAAPITAEITDWEMAFREYDAIHLTAGACDEVLQSRVYDGVDTAFVTWNAESTLWARWVFTPAA